MTKQNVVSRVSTILVSFKEKQTLKPQLVNKTFHSISTMRFPTFHITWKKMFIVSVWSVSQKINYLYGSTLSLSGGTANLTETMGSMKNYTFLWHAWLFFAIFTGLDFYYLISPPAFPQPRLNWCCGGGRGGPGDGTPRGPVPRARRSHDVSWCLRGSPAQT